MMGDDVFWWGGFVSSGLETGEKRQQAAAVHGRLSFDVAEAGEGADEAFHFAL